MPSLLCTSSVLLIQNNIVFYCIIQWLMKRKFKLSGKSKLALHFNQCRIIYLQYSLTQPISLTYFVIFHYTYLISQGPGMLKWWGTCLKIAYMLNNICLHLLHFSGPWNAQTELNWTGLNSCGTVPFKRLNKLTSWN